MRETATTIANTWSDILKRRESMRRDRQSALRAHGWDADAADRLSRIAPCSPQDVDRGMDWIAVNVPDLPMPWLSLTGLELLMLWLRGAAGERAGHQGLRPDTTVGPLGRRCFEAGAASAR